MIRIEQHGDARLSPGCPDESEERKLIPSHDAAGKEECMNASGHQTDIDMTNEEGRTKPDTVDSDESKFTIGCTGDAVTGDTVLFEESVFHGSWRKPVCVGSRMVVAKIVSDSYGPKKQQHTFGILVLKSWGTEPLTEGLKTTRKGRNIYRHFTKRLPWDDETQRQERLDDKHNRGDIARAQRHRRRTATYLGYDYDEEDAA